MNEEKIKKAFNKAKEDIMNLQSQLSSIKSEIQLLRQHLDRQTDSSTHNKTDPKTHPILSTTNQHTNPTQTLFKTHSSTDNYPLETSKTPNTNISTGNEGVSTDRQTDKQTDNSTGNDGVKVRLTPIISKNINQINKLEKAAELINSLDDIKKELRKKVKSLTNQEMTVLCTIYQLEEEDLLVDYLSISQKLNLTESSIRDYTKRIINKGIPISKTKINNKKVILSISQELRKIASLPTIIQLREL
jgi:hypothetical protein